MTLHQYVTSGVGTHGVIVQPVVRAGSPNLRCRFMLDVKPLQIGNIASEHAKQVSPLDQSIDAVLVEHETFG